MGGAGQHGGQPQKGLKFRLAPTPSGFLHLGNLYNFVLTEAFRKALGGKLLLRIDDLDRSRFRPEFLSDVFRQLEVLGIQPDEGPSGPEVFEAEWSQKHRLPLYLEALEALKPQLYACTCSRKDWKSQGSAYPGSCQNLGLALDGPNRHWRMAVPKSAGLRRLDLCGRQVDYPATLPEGDPILRNREGKPAYQLASVVDDLHFEVEAVVRGEDLRPSSGFQYWLAERMEAKAYAGLRCWHHPLRLNAGGEKLSKSSSKQGPLDVSRRELNRLESEALAEVEAALQGR